MNLIRSLIKKFYTLLYFNFTIFSFGISQEIPEEFIEFDTYYFSLDHGLNWDTNTSFGPIRFQSTLKSDTTEANGLNIKTQFGLHSLNDAIALYGYGHFTYKKYFYGYLYPRIVNDIDAFPRYSGISRDISRGGFNSGETDLSGIGFQNDWITMQIGRGRESWGAGNDIQLALSNNSPPYDYGMLGLDFGKLRVKYIHGFLESTSSQINRYMTARGIEWTNQKSMVVGLSETVIYSGENRPLDIGYLNPMATHLEIELNDRLNTVGASNANAVWQASIDWVAASELRLSGNFLFDEFVIDKVEKDAGKEHGFAYSLRLSYSLNKDLNLFLSNIKVGTPTFRHGQGTNNFVIRNKPLGWVYGSDGQEISLGVNYYNQRNLFIKVKSGLRELGEESIINRPYDAYADYLKGPFPSGNVEETIFLNSNIKWMWKPNIQILGGFEWQSDGDFELNLGVNAYLPKILFYR